LFAVRLALEILGFEYPKNVRFKCLRCALCCGDVKDKGRLILLLTVEAEHISKKTLKRVDEFAEEIKGFEPYAFRMKKTEDGKCMFLKVNSCTIYQIRPLICKFYPFELKETRSNRYTFAHTSECPAIGKGPLLKRNYFVRLFKKFAKAMTATRK
ncbi:MAG: YkgJ family cysteine cluster protein, partial [Candidatus Bathyarchaeota archaeon]|nr:YkgJ family cysteine cluster protein [Candidatus Bathyarchaeota archaeon]